jgi:serine/threonine protein kinase
MFVMEFMEHGDLKSFLVEHRAQLLNFTRQKSNTSYVNFTQCSSSTDPVEKKIQPFVHMALEVANGMAYLEKMKFVHRDLAARNCMVSSNFTIKIGDFSLTRFVDTSNYYMPQNDWEMPYHWTAAEDFTDRKFSSKSDGFSYGILLWELVTLGEMPYSVS